MARAIGDYHEGMFLGSLRKLLDPEREENKTILTVVKDEQVRLVVDTIRSTIGDLNKPDTGIVFTVNIDYEEGILLD